MDRKLVGKDGRDFDQTQSAAQDSYMKDVLAKVRQSDVTHNETVTRLNGTWMFNKSLIKERNETMRSSKDDTVY